MVCIIRVDVMGIVMRRRDMRIMTICNRRMVRTSRERMWEVSVHIWRDRNGSWTRHGRWRSPSISSIRMGGRGCARICPHRRRWNRICGASHGASRHDGEILLVVDTRFGVKALLRTDMS